MKRRIFQDRALDELRAIGDPRLEVLRPGDADAVKYFGDVAACGLDVAFDKWAGKPWGAAGETMAQVVIGAVDDDTAKAQKALESFLVDPAAAINRARSLFSSYGDEISASLLLAGLPDAYATEWGARVLIAHGDLEWALPRRIRQTALFLMTVLSNPVSGAGGKGDPYAIATVKKTCAGLRLFHEMIRKQLVKSAGHLLGVENATPINQEDLLGTLLTFTVTTFGVLDAFGVHWSEDDRESYLLFWDLIGAALGIGTKEVRDQLKSLKNPVNVPHPIRPRTVEDATQVLDQLHERQWRPVQNTQQAGRPFPWSGLAPGRMLGDALLGALADAMPAAKRSWPEIVIRELAPTVVQQRLGLEGAGLSSYASRWVAHRSPSVKVARSAALRMMANDITRHAMQSFLCAEGPPFVVPGLDLRELTATPVTRPSLELR